jgi:hypothetical protein
MLKWLVSTTDKNHLVSTRSEIAEQKRVVHLRLSTLLYIY